MTAACDILGPGIYDHLPAEDYHAHPALSQSGAKLLLPPSCPALFKWDRDNDRDSTKAFDVGHAAHTLALGEGAGIKELEFDSWRTKAVKEQAAAARAEGLVPLLTKDVLIVKAMAAKLREHPTALALFRNGKPEQSLIWTDRPTGVLRRARFDWLPDTTSGRMIIPDYKSALSAAPEKFQKSLKDFGYYQQAPWYEDAAVALELADEAAFIFVVQEKTPPFLVNVFEPDAEAKRIGRIRNRQAIDLFARCTEAEQAGEPNAWPSYSDGVELISLPPWFARQYEDIR